MTSEKLRTVTNEDMKLLFQWANDSSVRNASFCTEPITWETHVKWFENMMEAEDVIQLIYEYNEKPVGQVRLKIKDGTGLISYSIAPEYRGCGRATQMLKLLESFVKKEYPFVRELVAEVKQENEASRKVFEKLEYGDGAVVYRKSL